MRRSGTASARRPLRTAGLFSGVGGIERGLERSGHLPLSLCEKDPSARAVLKRRFAEIPIERDVRKLERLPDGTELLTAGFPCQDLSQVGRTNGIKGKDSSLVRHVFRLLRRQEVPWVLLENVPFMLWLKSGTAIAYIVSKLESLGYRWAYRVIDTRAFGIPQRRERVFILASLDDNPERLLLRDDAGPPPEPDCTGRACGFFWTEGNRGTGWAVDAIPPLKGGSGNGIPSPPAIWMPDGAIVTPDIRDAERLQGFPSWWTTPATAMSRRNYRWKLLGNAVTVHVARWLGNVILSPPGEVAASSVPFGENGSWPRAAYGSRDGRFAVDVSAWPVKRKAKPLLQFLKYPPIPLSARATSGFASRLKASSLRYPPEFMEALLDHVAAVSNNGDG